MLKKAGVALGTAAAVLGISASVAAIYPPSALDRELAEQAHTEVREIIDERRGNLFSIFFPPPNRDSFQRFFSDRTGHRILRHTETATHEVYLGTAYYQLLLRAYDAEHKYDEVDDETLEQLSRSGRLIRILQQVEVDERKEANPDGLHLVLEIDGEIVQPAYILIQGRTRGEAGYVGYGIYEFDVEDVPGAEDGDRLEGRATIKSISYAGETDIVIRMSDIR